MTKLRNIVGIALVAMSMLTGLAVTSARAQQFDPGQYQLEKQQACEYELDYGYVCY